jgi:hypothetical protein
MNTIDIPERDIHVEFPSNWDELTNDEFAFVIQTWIKLMDGLINVDEFNLIILYNLLGIKRSPFQDWKDKRLSRQQLEDKFANIWQLTETLHWLIRLEETESGPVGMLNWSGIENRIPTIETEWATLEGPSDCFLNITFAEYRAAWKHFEAYTRSQKHTDIDHLVAILYRPERGNYKELQHQPDFDGQTREPFNPHITSHYAELIVNIPFWQKYIVYVWFGNCDRFIKEEELELDGKPFTFAPLFKKQRTDDSDEVEILDENDLGLTGLLYLMAESKLFGSIVETDKTGYIDILTALLYWKQQTDRIKKP